MAEEINIGAKVQQFRKKSGLSLRELAAQVELSPSMLSQIENDAVNPSINTLKNIAQALHVPLFLFFKDDEPQPERLIVRRGENRIIGHSGEEVLYKLLTPTVDCSIEFCLMEIPPHTASSDIEREHTGEEVAYVISGQVELHLGDSVYRLCTGDSVQIPPATPHRWVNGSDEEFRAVFAITPPSF